MADTLKTRVGRVIAGSVHALLDKIEDQAPEAMMEQSIREADGVIDEVRHELGLLSANRHLSQQQHATLNGHHSALAAQIDEALAQGREDLVRAAVARQLDIEAQLPVLETTLAEQTRQEAELQGFVAALLAADHVSYSPGQYAHMFGRNLVNTLRGCNHQQAYGFERCTRCNVGRQQAQSLVHPHQPLNVHRQTVQENGCHRMACNLRQRGVGIGRQVTRRIHRA